MEDGEAKRTRPESSVNSVSRSYGSDLMAVLISSSSPAAGGGMELLRWMERGSFKKKAGILGCAAGAAMAEVSRPKERRSVNVRMLW